MVWMVGSEREKGRRERSGRRIDGKRILERCENVLRYCSIRDSYTCSFEVIFNRRCIVA